MDTFCSLQCVCAYVCVCAHVHVCMCMVLMNNIMFMYYFFRLVCIFIGLIDFVQCGVLDFVKHGVLILVSEVQCYRNHHCYYCG